MKIVDGNKACSSVAYLFSEICSIYPITPSSPMAENIDYLTHTDKKNIFNDKPTVVEMESELGAAGALHGALLSGSLASTYTASQGLLLMIPNLYKIAGECLPGVIHVAARSIATHALSIFGDHSDIYSARMTGCCMLASSNVYDAQNLAAVAHLSAIKGSLPFIHFFDGFRTSHELNTIKELPEEKLLPLVDKNALESFKKRALLSDLNYGTSQTEDVYFQITESRNELYDKMPDIVNEYMTKINEIMGTSYKPFNYYGSENAKYIIIAMGSVNDTIKLVIDNEIKNGNNDYGLIEVHLYRPFSNSYLSSIIPSSVKKIAVLDRTKEAGSSGEPLYLDVVNALKDRDIKIIGGRYGLSSKNTPPAMIKSVYDNLSGDMKSNFTIGINDDVTNLSLDIDNSYRFDNNNYEMLIYGYGSDGMVSTSKDILRIIGDNTKKYVQGYFQYDSKKSGGVTRSHIRIGDTPIRSSYYVDNPNFIVVSKDSYMYKYDILDNIREGGTLLLNTNLSSDDLIRSLPNKVKYLLALKNVNVYTIDAYKVAGEMGLKNKINTSMEVCIFKIMDIYNINKVISIMKDNIKSRFSSKGKKIIDINNKVVDNSLKYLKRVSIDSSWVNLEYSDNKKLNFNETINLLKGDTLPVSSFLDVSNGVFEGGTTKNEKRNIAESIPNWIPENCSECNKCAFACPHGVIRPFLLDKDDKKIESIPSIMPKDVNFAIGINYEECTGCGLCAVTCPGKMGKKALEMVPNKRHDKEFDYLLKNNINDKYDVIISNPPYISYDEDIMDVVYNNEPHMALYADDNGLYFYDKILRECRRYLNDRFLIAFEIGYKQGNDILNIINKYFDNVNISLEKDYSGRDRFIFIWNH